MVETYVYIIPDHMLARNILSPFLQSQSARYSHFEKVFNIEEPPLTPLFETHEPKLVETYFYIMPEHMLATSIQSPFLQSKSVH